MFFAKAGTFWTICKGFLFQLRTTTMNRIRTITFRKYQKEWAKKRRLEFFINKSCTICGSVKNLELDHIDYKTKTSHRIWSLTKSKRDAELAKCQVLCKMCHRNKTGIENKTRFAGELNGNAKLTNNSAELIRSLYSTHSFTPKYLMGMFPISKSTFWRIVGNLSYRSLDE